MIAFMVLCGIAIYLFLGLLIIVSFAKSTKGRIIGIIILILIPTWDVIIGYPTFWYLCKFRSGVRIYKTVENVEGFYAGERDKKLTPWMPDKNYKYMDYRIKETDQYYRSYWLNNNTSENCYKPHKKNAYDREYQVSFYEKGRCFAVLPLQPEEVSRYEVGYDHGKMKRIFPLIGLDKSIFLKIIDRHNNDTLAIYTIYRWNRGWVRATLLNISGSQGELCPFKLNSKAAIKRTLKNSQETTN